MHAMDDHSGMRTDETPPLVTTCMDLENIMVSEISQTEKVKNHLISLMCRI